MVDKSEKFEWMVRLGYAARGLVYILLGYLAISTAGKAGDGQAAVFDMLQDVPLGTPLLYLVALGLFGYAVFKLLDALTDLENHGSDGGGIAKRIGSGASSVAHFALAYTAYQYAAGTRQSSNGGGGEEAAGSLLSWETGSFVLGIIGVGFIIAAAMQAKNAYDAHFMHRISGRAPSSIRTIGRLGHAARAVVFLLIGWSLVKSAWFSQSQEIKGLGEAIVSLSDNGPLYTLVAIGLILFGVFSLIAARYRIIPDVSSASMKPTLH